MWLFTKYGFFSAVCARQGDGRHGEPVDPDRIMVRARKREHLSALQTRFPDQLADSELLESPNTDYRYRLFVDKLRWLEVMRGLAEEMDYDNFKAKVASHQGGDGAEYKGALHEVWSVMNAMQR